MATDYHWLRNKTDEHRARLRDAALGNLNALKHSRYAKRPKPAAVCNACPLAERCPQFRPGEVCLFTWEELQKLQRRTAALL